MYRFDGERILIAGGSSGVGLAAAQILSESGAEVIITGRDKMKLERAAETVGGRCLPIAFDASDKSERENVIPIIGKIDHLVLAFSGGKGGGAFLTLSDEDLHSAFESKFWGHFSFAKDFHQSLRADGSITFISAISARAANPGTSGLSAMNAAIEGLVKPLAVELAPLRVNAVSPGVIDTPWWDIYDAHTRQILFSQFAAQTPVNRIGKPEDIAMAIVFLIGNTFMTGTVIECDGGLRLTNQKL
ncbi:MAG TPA: SDR family oxidoreductase [Spirochaetota bacterium]